MALVFTQTDLDNAKSALVSGALEVRVGDRLIRYRSQDEIISLIALIQSYLDGISTTVNTAVIKATYSKGAK